MRAKKPNALSRRRSRRPDGNFYRSQRRRGMGQGRSMNRIGLILVAVILIGLLFWLANRWFF
jgi:hypothetical protein